MDGPGHLARRFFAVLRTRPLTPTEQAEVALLLSRPEAGLFFGQPAGDQRHALACARTLLSAAPSRLDLARVALLHDVGKAFVRLGVAGRVLATVLALFRLPAPGRLGSYLAHGAQGARNLAQAGADELTVAYARHHHGRRPAGIAPGDWELLTRADHT